MHFTAKHKVAEGSAQNTMLYLDLLATGQILDTPQP